ncbi:hypothetical protein ACTG9Q_13325 [Actinokineospora sp. 24-640]
MALLPAVVPQLVEKRSELVPARLARKVAPLFGVPYEGSPFWPLTWVCDITAITVSELSRGAPLPTRAAAANLRGVDHSGEWVEHDRAVVPATGRTLPNEIVAATVNRFGPDTRSAVVLMATNVLLAPVTRAIADALPLLRGADGGDLPTVQWIAAWAATAVEVYRSQPALVTAALTARGIQRESSNAPRFPWARHLADRPRGRCEIGAAPVSVQHDPVTRPRDLDVLDVLAAGRLNATGALPGGETRVTGRGVGDRLVDLMVGMLADLGQPDSIGHVWVSERVPSQVVAEALVPSSGLVRELVEKWAHGPGSLEPADQFADALADAMARPVRLPSPAEVAALPLLTRRALALAAMGVIRQMGLLAPSQWLCGPEFDAMLTSVTDVVEGAFPDDDPIVPDTRLRVAVLRSTVDRHAGHAGNATAGSLQRATENCLTATGLDRGTRAELLSLACVELQTLRSTVLGTENLVPVLHQYWAAFAEAVEADMTDPDTACGGLSFQLHNYATFLGGNKDDEKDLRTALRLFADSVIPARTRLHNRDRDFRPLARSLYLAADAAVGLAALSTDRGNTAEALTWTEQAYEWAHRVLANELYGPGRMHPRMDDSLAALRLAPVLVLAVESGVSADRQADVARAAELLDLVERWLKETTDGRVERTAYYTTVAALRARITACG